METFVARQPIFDSKLDVFGYELLYRSSSANFYSALDGDLASSELISNSMLIFGLENLTRNRRAFINFTAKLLESDVVALLPQNKLVVEVLEDVDPGETMLNACKKIKDAGYLLVLDDFVYHEKYCSLLELVDIIKVDFMQTQGEARKEVMDRVNCANIKFLAEKVENREDLDEAIKMGYTYFQGYFFSKPEIMTSRDIPAFKLTYLKILQEINNPDIDFDQVENLIKCDLALSYKLLRFINSAAFHFKAEISSIKQALTLLGQREISRWVSLLTLKSILEDKPEELFITAVCRANFCELLAPRVGLKKRSQDLFLMGLFSLMDAFLDRPLDTILNELPLVQDVKDALTVKGGLMGEVYRLVLDYEKGDFQGVSIQCMKLNLEEKEVIQHYLKSLEQGNKIFIKNKE